MNERKKSQVRREHLIFEKSIFYDSAIALDAPGAWCGSMRLSIFPDKFSMATHPTILSTVNCQLSTVNCQLPYATKKRSPFNKSDRSIFSNNRIG
ncbi:MAG: hypothetical protein JGK03_27580 [Microcoleus sp. PH2017_25_DOB_D_A]|uniref:hypothetical protein n=1 Tax=unclassified Microcoleus TaxID=2642155 RepID=UPI001D7C20B1|nr:MULTISPECIES: hypothetical protein [unclassified Microcoleus]TAE07379.1 MAG: hypothetical protein EAZ94_28760 [Oscillatoriales cyanobacterium]MCC3494565.1 hypothetical protein [Microcoleus sp. PH2017_16_JOR_D_A]MCC3537863.1 hypothetical protein [Microcoleus sp. PH2017_25_DOB_D_A]MCC3550236.1 hypothetical protein [Microcoleus sp. PH2017_24_DOB_U_A]TAE18457.1 MAG: hypothetical protein EAZ93_29545 [Oscillatoriales cyanobacterium]